MNTMLFFYVCMLAMSFLVMQQVSAAPAVTCPLSCPLIKNIDNTTSSCCGAGTAAGCGTCSSSSCLGVGLADCGAECAVSGCIYGLANPACSNSFCWGVIGGSKCFFLIQYFLTAITIE